MSEDIQIATAKTWARLEQPHVWALYGHGNLLVKINLDDGSYEFGETYTLDEAAKVFWQAVCQHMPKVTNVDMVSKVFD